MNKSVFVGALAAVVGTVIIVAGAFVLLRAPSNGQTSMDASTQASTSTAVQEGRPPCPNTGVAGIKLECLGATTGAMADGGDEISVVNVWAWWCQPCRAELPVIEEFSASHPDITVVGVHADPDAGKGVALLNDLGVGMASYQDPDNLFAGELGLPSVIPLTLVFRGEERIGLFVQEFESVDHLEAAVSRSVADGR